MPSETLNFKFNNEVNREQIERSRALLDLCYKQIINLGLAKFDPEVDRFVTWALAWRLAKIGRESATKEVLMNQRKSPTVLLLRMIQSELNNDPFEAKTDQDFVLLEADVVKAYSIVESVVLTTNLIDDEALWEAAAQKVNPQDLSQQLAVLTPTIKIPQEEGFSAKALRTY